jgi:AcrR family transcriptional regulator
MSRQVKATPTPGERQRVRRGSTEDHEGLRKQIVAAAFAIIERNGFEALSMRVVAAEVGLSAMALYRYFENKAALLRALGDEVMIDAESGKLAALAASAPTARARLRASIESFIAYWEEHPARFRLFYMTSEMMVAGTSSPLAGATAYERNVARTDAVIGEFIAEVGGDRKRALLARDLRLSLMLGYLHASIANRRFPWNDLDALRRSAIDTIMLGLENCVRKARKA